MISRRSQCFKHGGVFRRFAPCRNVDVRTAEATGEEAVNGSRAPWLNWTADFADGPASVRFTAAPETDDPSFGGVNDYPGVGSALAWDRPLRLDEQPLTRTISMDVGD